MQSQRRRGKLIAALRDMGYQDIHLSRVDLGYYLKSQK